MPEGEKRVLFIGQDPAYIRACYVGRVERLSGMQKGTLAYDVAEHLEAAESILSQGRITHVVMLNLYHPKTNNSIAKGKDGIIPRKSAKEVVKKSGLPSLLFTPNPECARQAPGKAVTPKRNKRGLEIVPSNPWKHAELQAQEIVNLLDGKYK